MTNRRPNRDDMLVMPEQLAQLLEQQPVDEAAPRTIVLDVRWHLLKPNGRDAYSEGHVPGAVYVDLDTELAKHGTAGEGRHPLPGDEVLTAAARRWGLRAGDRVVAYDAAGGLGAARAWWLLRDAGVDVRLLDGGWNAWVASDLPVESGEHLPTPSDVTLTGGRMPVLSMSEAGELAARGVLLDARATERYTGASEPMDPVAGHIPGARNLPATDLCADGELASQDALRASFESAGVYFGAQGPEAKGSENQGSEAPLVGAYCGSGITASLELFALELAGAKGALYPGSWSQWANHAEQPVAKGAERGL